MAKRKFELTDKQVAELTTAYDKSKDADFCKKALAVRLYGTNKPVQEIKDLIGCSRTSLMEWVQRYRRQDLDGLSDRRQGGNHYKLTGSQRAEIGRTLHQYTPAQLLGEECASSSGAHWSVADLKLLIHRRYDLVYKSPTSYRVLLRESGLSYQRTERIFKSKSATKQADFEEQLEKNF